VKVCYHYSVKFSLFILPPILVQQPVGENFQKFFAQIKEDIKEMLAQEKAEIKAASKKDEDNVLQLNAEVKLS
jgi:restriction endonuclease S subunit